MKHSFLLCTSFIDFSIAHRGLDNQSQSDPTSYRTGTSIISERVAWAWSLPCIKYTDSTLLAVDPVANLRNGRSSSESEGVPQKDCFRRVSNNAFFPGQSDFNPGAVSCLSDLACCAENAAKFISTKLVWVKELRELCAVHLVRQLTHWWGNSHELIPSHLQTLMCSPWWIGHRLLDLARFAFAKDREREGQLFFYRYGTVR